MLTVERVAALHRVSVFAEVPGRVLAAVARVAVEVTVDEGTIIIEEGAIEDHLFAIVSGRVRVHLAGRTLRELTAGAAIGELAALVPEPRSASVTAVEQTVMLRIEKPVLDELLADRPTLAMSIIAALVGMLRDVPAAATPVD